MTDQMKAVEIEGGKGPASALRLGEQPMPVAGPGQVLIRVRAAGVNMPDVLQRRGFYPPPAGASAVLGLEVAGEIVETASGWAAGDRVCALLAGGGYAEYATVDARHVLPLPADMGFDSGAALPETVFTVFANVFEHGALKAGETLLLHGATSGIGTTAIQMAKACGARVITTSRSAEKADQAKALGADISLDASQGNWAASVREAGGADVVLDMVGASYLAGNLEALNIGGRIVYIAALGGPVLEVPVMALMQKRAVLTGSTLRPRDADEKARLTAEVKARIWPLVESGQIRPVVEARFALADAASAHEKLETGTHLGKLVLLT